MLGNCRGVDLHRCLVLERLPLAVIVLIDTDMMTIPVGLGTVLTSYGIRSAQIKASVVLAASPVIVIVLFFQWQIVQGIVGMAIKD